MSATDQRNVILVSIDSLRSDYCGYVSGSRDATPNLTRMAQDGLSFTRAIAPGPSTPESMPAVFTGQYPIERPGIGDGSLAERQANIRRHMKTRESIPERLAKRGYATAGFTPNPFTSRHFGFEQGFDHFQDFMGEDRESGSLYDRIFDGFLKGDPASSFARVLLNFWQREEVFKPWESYYQEIIEWASDAEEPYFIWVFLMDAHNPYLPSSDYRSQSRLEQFHANFSFWRESHETPFSPRIHDQLETAYEDAVRYADAFLHRLQADLDAEEHVVVVHGDHGEAFGEHGTYGHEPYLYPENVHVPLVVSGVDPWTIAEPVSLRNVPEIVLRAATDSIDELELAPYVSTFTTQGDAFGVYTADDHHIFNGVDRSPSTESPGVVFDEIADELLESRREMQRIENAIDMVSNL